MEEEASTGQNVSEAQRLAISYKNTPKLRALVEGIGSFLPGVTAANTYLVERLSQMERERTEALFRDLEATGAILTPELIASEDFLHCFTITVRAAQRTRRHEKIRLFARLLASATKSEAVTDVDEYQELLGTLVEMSDREIRVLTILERHERSTSIKYADSGKRENDYTQAQQYWSAFLEDIQLSARVKKDETTAVLVRLTRTGCYGQVFPFMGNGPHLGRLTPRYYRLRDLISDAEGNIIEPTTDPR